MIPKRRIMFVFGTRPEAIKMAPLLKQAEKYPDVLECVIVITAQHREMLDQVLKVFDIHPDYDLEIMEDEQTIPQIVTKSLQGLEEVILEERPDMIMVQGDTSTAFAAALSSFYHKVPLAHIEAGLRTNLKFVPFPEEMNRKLISQIADLNFAPTLLSVQNLIAEGVKRSNIHLTGNTVIDALFEISNRNYDLKKIGISLKEKDKRIILVTAHRRESFGAPLKRICEAVSRIAKKYSDTKVIVPVHKNPVVREIAGDILSDISNVDLIEPLDYEPFVHLMKSSYLILTDSGGIQEEAPSLGKPVLVLREVTERPEAVAAGTVKVVGTRVDSIVEEAEKLLENREEYERMSRAVNPYGDGRAAPRIVHILLRFFGFVDTFPEEFKIKEEGYVKSI